MRIVVIGAGLLGISTAYYLAKCGHEVIVTDRQQGPALETSFANGGMLTPSQSAPWNTPGIALKVLRWLGRSQSPILIKPSALLSIAGWGLTFMRNSGLERFEKNQRKNYILASYNLQQLKRLRQQLGLSYDESSKGTMKIYRSTAAYDEACKHMQIFSNEQTGFRLLDRNGVTELEPALNAVRHTIAGGIYFHQDESGDAYKFCRELSEHALKLGVSFHFDTIVTGMLKTERQIKAIITSKGQVQADAFVLAAGSYSALLANYAGFSLPIRPVKGYSLTLGFNQHGSGLALPVIDETNHIAFTPLGNRLRIAGMAELAGYDRSISETRVNKILGYFREIFPEVSARSNINDVQKWTGLRPYTCDGVPLIGKSPLDNLYLNTGHGHLGWTLATGSARLIADQISYGKTDIDLKPYQLDRFD